MIRFVLILVTVATLIPGIGWCGRMTDSQKHVLKIANVYGEAECEGFGRVVQGVAWQESLAGLLKDRKNRHSDDPDIERRYFGVMQLKLIALRDVERKYGLDFGGTKEQRAERLQKDDVFNVIVGALYLRYLYGHFKGDIRKTVLAYNIGMGFVDRHGTKYDPNKYVDGVMGHIENIMVDFNEEHGLR